MINFDIQLTSKLANAFEAAKNSQRLFARQFQIAMITTKFKVLTVTTETCNTETLQKAVISDIEFPSYSSCHWISRNS